MRRAAAALTAALALALALAGCGRAVADRDLVAVERLDLIVAVEVTGELAAVDSTDIMPPGINDVWSFKLAMLADEGAEVAADEPVVGFDASELQRELETMMTEADAARTKLDKRRADAALARRDEELRLAEAEATLRKATLKAAAPAGETAAVELKLIELDRQLAEMARTRAQNRAAQVRRNDAAELERLTEHHAYAVQRVADIQASIAKMNVRAPRAGTVVYPANGRGEKRKVGDSVWRMQAVLQVVGLDRMVGDGVIDEVDLARVADGQPVTLRLDALPDVELRGQVKSIARTLRARSDTDPSKVAEVKVELAAAGTLSLRPGMRFRGEVETLRAPGVLVIPAEAVFVTADGPVVYRVRDGEVARVPVQLGRRNARLIEVTGGLAQGDRVSRVDPAGRAR